MARTAIGLLVAVALLAGCGKGRVDPEKDVRSAVEGYAKAFATRDYQALCDRYFDPKVVAALEETGLPCEAAIRPKVSSTRHPKLVIRTVKVKGKTARVMVHTTADGEAATDDVLALVKTRGAWRITPLGVTGPQPVGP